MTLLTISILIPTYNQAAYLSDCLISALSQDYPHLEVVVSDDCSTDNTSDIVKSFDDPRIKYFRNEKNLGRVANYRKSLYERASGDWVINLDGDDILIDKNYISKSISFIESDPGIAMVFADRFERDDPIDLSEFRNFSNSEYHPRILNGTDYILSLPSAKERIYHLTALYNRSTALSLGFYNCDILSSDSESLWRLAIGRKIAYIPNKVAVWRRHPSNASRTASTGSLIKNYDLYKNVYNFAIAHVGGNYIRPFRKWLTRIVAKKFYTNLLSLRKDRDNEAIQALSSFIKNEYPQAYFLTLFSIKYWIKRFLLKWI